MIYLGEKATSINEGIEISKEIIKMEKHLTSFFRLLNFRVETLT